MPDPKYVEYPMLFRSAGITARLLEDTASTEQYLNLTTAKRLMRTHFLSVWGARS